MNLKEKLFKFLYGEQSILDKEIPSFIKRDFKKVSKEANKTIEINSLIKVLLEKECNPIIAYFTKGNLFIEMYGGHLTIIDFLTNKTVKYPLKELSKYKIEDIFTNTVSDLKDNQIPSDFIDSLKNARKIL